MNKISKIFQEKYTVLNKGIIYFLFLSMSLFLSTDYFPIIKILLGILAIYVVFFSIYKKNNPICKFIKSPFFIWYIVFWGFMILITYIRNPYQLVTLVKTWVVFTVYISEFGILYSDDETRKNLNLSNMIEIIAVFLSIWILIWEFPLLIQGERIGYSVMIGNPNSAGTLLSIYVFFIIYNLTQVNENKKKVIKHILSLILCFTIILATGSKKAIIVGLISILLLLFKNGHIVKKRIIYLFIALVVATTACFTVPGLYNNVGRRFLSLFGELGIIEFQSDYSSKQRMKYTEKAIELWKDNMIIGGGYDNFKLNSGYDTYSHNNYTELLCSVGILGTLVYYGYYLFLLKKSFFNREMKSIMYLLFIIGVLISDIGAVTFYIYPLYYIMLLIINYDLKERKKKEIINGK